MSMLAYTTAPVEGFKVRHLQPGVGGMKGHIIAIDLDHTSVVRQTGQYKPLVTMVNHIATELLPQSFTWTSIQLSCNVMTKPLQHLHDSSPWSTVFSTGQHTRGHKWVEAGCVCSGQGGRRCIMQFLDVVTRDCATYNVSQQPVVLSTGAWHETCLWHRQRRLVVDTW